MLRILFNKFKLNFQLCTPVGYVLSDESNYSKLVNYSFLSNFPYLMQMTPGELEHEDEIFVNLFWEY